MKSACRIHRLYLFALASIAIAVTASSAQADETSTEFAIVPWENLTSTDGQPDTAATGVMTAALAPLNEATPSYIASPDVIPSDTVAVDTTADLELQKAPPVRLAVADTGQDSPPAAVESDDTGRAHITSPYIFEEGDRERDFSIGYGSKIKTHRFEGRTDENIIQALPRWGRFRNARQEILWEVPITYFGGPEDGVLGGVTLMFRQHLTRNRHFMPYIEFGPGLTLTSLKIPELGGAFQFSLQGGAGIRTALSKNSDLVIGARWFHLSNAGTRRPNTGLNNYLITVGYSKLY